MEVTIREANQGPGLAIKKNAETVHDTTEVASAPAPVEEVVEAPVEEVVEAPAEEVATEEAPAESITDGIKKID